METSGAISILGIIALVLMVLTWPILAWKYFVLNRKHNKPLDDYYDQDDDNYDDGIDDQEDAWEGGFWDAGDPKNFHLNLAIDYQDANGDCTKREISVRAFDSNLYGGIIMAHCHLRNATRTFRFDRIESAVNTDNGEIINGLRAYIEDKYKETPVGSLDYAIQERPDVFHILFYLAKTDGRAMPKEKEVMASYYRKATGCTEIEKKDVTEIMGKYDPISYVAFKQAAKRIKKSPDFAEIMDSITQMIAASKDDVLQKDALTMLS